MDFRWGDCPPVLAAAGKASFVVLCTKTMTHFLEVMYLWFVPDCWAQVQTGHMIRMALYFSSFWFLFSDTQLLLRSIPRHKVQWGSCQAMWLFVLVLNANGRCLLDCCHLPDRDLGMLSPCSDHKRKSKKEEEKCKNTNKNRVKMKMHE